MKRIFWYIVIFIVGFILGRINVDYYLCNIYKKITMFNFNLLTEIFTNREIASGFWLIALFIFMLLKSKIRESILSLFRVTLKKQLIIPFMIIMVYTIIIVLIALHLSQWQWKYIKDILFWVIFVGIPVSFNVTLNEDDGYFFNMLKQNFKFIVIVEFLLSTVTFSILTEMILLPIITLLILFESVASLDKANYKIKNLITFILAILGFIILGLTIKKAVQNYIIFSNFDLLIKFIIPIILSVLFIPVAYGFAIFSEYQQIFIRLRFIGPKDKVLNKKLKKEILKSCKLSYKKARRFRYKYLKKTYAIINDNDLNYLVKEFNNEFNKIESNFDTSNSV